ncbi:tetratricopeptide repeat protein [Oleomonas cavernae]|uniref:Tetratricopeptide repeat protein n=1 Tax=Oleomonas cavernae TaxID=2320859 RepID=A0A418WCQ2_9PROT|nr:tetratricopeptide repeat protein [Oleomonas cavernae]RJF87817.1 tetratricopeptide repeat protein [Oleomonas cavernae]
MKRSSSFARRGHRRSFPLAFAVGLLVSGCGMPGEANTESAAKASDLSTIKVRTLSGSYLAARYAHGTQDSAGSAMFYDGALSLDPGNTNLRRQVLRSALLAGNYIGATNHAEVVARLERSDPLAPLITAIAEMRTGRFAEARKRLESLPTNTALDVVGPIMVAWAIQGAGDTDGALAALAKLDDNPGVAPFRLYHSALIAALGGREKIARDSFAALRASAGGGWIRSILAEGAFLEGIGDKASAVTLYRSAVRAGSANPGLIEAAKRLERGEAPTPMVSSASEGVAEVMYGIASLLAQEKANEPVLVYLRLALMARPVFPEAQILLAEAFDDVGDKGQATALFRAVPETSPLHSMAEIRYVLLLANGGDTAEALALLDRRIEADPVDIEALVTKGDILRQGEKFADAADAYTDALDAIGTLDARHWTILFSRGICLERLKRWEAAEADLLKALELQPDQPSVLNYLAYSWIEQGRNLKRAEDMVSKAVASKPDDGYIVDSLGWVYFRQGRFPDAVAQLEKAVELRPGDPTINDHLGDAYWAVGRKLEAEFQWRTAIALKPDDDQLPLIEAKLEKGLPPEMLVPGVD